MLFNPTTKALENYDDLIAIDPGAKNIGLAWFSWSFDYDCNEYKSGWKLSHVETFDTIRDLNIFFDHMENLGCDSTLLVFEKPFSKMNADTFAQTCISVGYILGEGFDFDYIACISNNITLGKPKNDTERINNACRMFGQCGDVHGASAIGAGVTYINKHGGVFCK